MNQLEKHLGHHLKILATFALPSIGSDGRASDDSVAAQEPTQSEGETRQSVSTNSEKTQAADASSDTTFEPFSTMGSEQQTTYLLELAAFEEEGGEERVFLGEAGHWLNDWGEHDPLPQKLTLSEIFDEISLIRKRRQTKPAGSDDAPPIHPGGKGDRSRSQYYTRVYMIEVFEVALVSAKKAIGSKRQVSESDVRYQSLLRDYLRDFTQVVLRGLSPDSGMVDSLEKLQAQLSLPLPSEVPSDTNQDWGFLNMKGNHTSEFFESDQKHPQISVENVCQWLASVDQSDLLETYAHYMCARTGSWLTNTDEFKRFKVGKLNMLLVDGLRRIHHNSTMCKYLLTMA